MNIKRRALGGFSGIVDDELIVLGATVLQAMENNAYFPTPVPDLEEVSQSWRQYQLKLSIARRKGSRQA